MKIFIKLSLGAVFVCGLSSCGTFPLAQVTGTPIGTTAAQRETDVLYCKDQANLRVNSASNETGNFLLGLTIVGTPIAFEKDKTMERNAFANCMTARGYQVTMPNGSIMRPTENTSVLPTAGLPSTYMDRFSLILPPGWEKQTVTAELTRKGVFYYALNRTKDCGVVMVAFPANQITDVRTLAESLLTSQMSALKDASESSVQEIELNGTTGYRFTVTGTVPTGISVTYLQTILEKGATVIDINAWTSSANFQLRRASLESLSGDVTDLQNTQGG